MQTVYAQMSVSLDGYVAGPGDGPGNPLGDGGERVHEWIFDVAAWRERHGLAGGRTDRDHELVQEIQERSGAVVMGRRMFDNGEEPWGPNPPFRAPVFVVTSRAREPLPREGGTTFTFVADGIESALAQAKAAAGGRDVEVAGGAEIVQRYLAAGLLDELELHVAPVFLGGGIRLFDRPELAGVRLEPTQVIDSPGATHIRYRVAR
ncbi:MAG: bifunctional deaminase-reductase domain protein [Solirubrobacterales bacterium]|nr:bifunctional deaminase-reductase domain protein [Solirubrobacterales bacterium]